MVAPSNIRVHNPSYKTRVSKPDAPETLVVVKEGPPGPPGQGVPVEYHGVATQTTHLVTHSLGHDPVAIQVLINGEEVEGFGVTFPTPGQSFLVTFDIPALPVIRYI